jgi:flagellar hook-associated protein 3 FlgL
MSMSISGYGIMPELIANSTQIHNQLDTLTEQASTGLVSQSYAGLGGQASVSLDLNPELAALQTDQDNIGQATGSMGVTQATMTQIQQIAANFVGDIPDLDGLSGTEVDTVAAQANSALQQVANLLDTQDGDVYVFAGQDSGNPPVPSPDNILNSGFYSQINQAVAALGSNGASATAAATLAIAGSNASGTSPFSTYLSQPAADISAPVVQTGEGSTVQTGLLASANSVAVSTGSSTTGSYMRDLMRALATLGSLSSSQMGDAGFAGLVQDTGTSLNGVVSAMATDVGILGNSQSNLTSIQTQLSDTSTALTTQLSSVQDVDMAQTLSSLTSDRRNYRRRTG